MDELVLDVNSAERLHAARQWLEAIPGVTFLGLKTQDVDGGAMEVPLDDRMGFKQSVEITPELASHLQESFHQHYPGLTG